MIILGKDKIDERYNINNDGIITDLQGNVQETKLHQGRPTFKGTAVYRILMWTKFSYRDTKIWCIHHLDENPLNNSIDNLVFLTRSQHNSLHKKGKHCSEETKKKLSESNKGRIFTKQHKENISKSGKGRHWKLTEKTKRKMSDTRKGKNNPMYGKHWKKDPITGKRIYY